LGGARRFTAAIKDRFSMTASDAGNCRALHEFFQQSILSRAIGAAQQPSSSIKLGEGHEFCACRDSVEMRPRFSTCGALFADEACVWFQLL